MACAKLPLARQVCRPLAPGRAGARISAQFLGHDTRHMAYNLPDPAGHRFTAGEVAGFANETAISPVCN